MIQVESLSYRFKGKQVPTLKDMSFEVGRGEIFGFLGPSGAGKSTTQKILIGLLEGYHGSVRVFGKEIKKREEDFYERIGVAFEFPNFYHKLTGLENLKLFQGFYKKFAKDPKELLQLVGLEKDADARFNSYSKGMKMRLNFCRAFMHDPDILFLDEPTSGLDPANAKKLKDIMLELKMQGKTIILTTHNMHLAEELCDRVAFMVDGKIALIDSPKGLKLRGKEKRLVVEVKEHNEIVKHEFPLAGIGENTFFHSILQYKEIETIHTQEGTLEDVFLDVTGRSLQ